MEELILDYKEVQQIARETIEYAKTFIKPGMNLLEVRKLCEQKMLELGADSFWYWDIGAFVFARTIILENGVVTDKDKIVNAEWKNGLLMEDKLHNELIEFVGMKTTFEELYYHINELILKEGFINLDFMGNLGHSIVKNKNDRVYTEKGNTQMISDIKYFTFEPHISIPGSKYGYKKENIYYFENGKLLEL